MKGIRGTAMMMLLLNGGAMASANPVTFGPPTDFAAFGIRNDVIVDKAVQGDFDEDGNLDLLYIKQFSFLPPQQQVARINVIFGNGNGSYLGATPEFIPANDSRNTWSIESGSLNGDGHLDVVLVNSETHNITVLLGNGDGTFSDQTVSTLPLMGGPRYQGLGDLDGDGDTDIAIGNWGGSLVTLINDGAGNFVLDSTITGHLPGNPSRTDIEIGDLNGDGRNDIVSSRVNGIDVYLNTGYPTFSSSTVSTTSTGQLLLEDFNGDGTLDLATYTTTGTDILIYDGDGSGGFSPRSSLYPTGASNSTSIASADFNGDGLFDIATANKNGAGNVSVLLADGTGGFAAPALFPNPGTLVIPQFLLVGDMSNDGKPDLFTLNKNSGPTAPYSSIMLNTTETVVVDETPPTITNCPGDLVLECDGLGNTADIQAWLSSFAATDESGVESLVHDYVGLTAGCGSTGTAFVTFTATDVNGNQSACTATVSIQDTTAPSIDVAALSATVECDGNGNSAELQSWLDTVGGAAASDGCGDVVWNHDFAFLSDGCAETGSATVNFTATDHCGNSSTTTASFTIVDTTGPDLGCDLVLVPQAGGSSQGSGSSNNWTKATFEVVFASSDVCSTTLTTSAGIAVGGQVVSVVNGQNVVLKIKKKVKIHTKKGVLNIEGPAFELQVNSADDCGNLSGCVTSPVFPVKPSSSSGSSKAGSSKSGSSKSASSKSGSSQSGSSGSSETKKARKK